MSLRKPTSHGRKSISTLVLLVDGKVGNAHDISRCVPDLLMHLGICRYRGAPRACRLSHSIEINWVQLDRGPAELHLRRWLGRSFDRIRPHPADTILLRANVYSFRGPTKAAAWTTCVEQTGIARYHVREDRNCAQSYCSSRARRGTLAPEFDVVRTAPPCPSRSAAILGRYH